MKITFIPFKKNHIPLYFKWAEKEHVKQVWFRPGYSPKEKIYEKLESKDIFPYIIEVDAQAIGYIQYYHFLQFQPPALCRGDRRAMLGCDIFIGEETYIGNGYGVQIMQAFVTMLFTLNSIKKVIVDPFIENKQAICCYRKAGFREIGQTQDEHKNDILIMEIQK